MRKQTFTLQLKKKFARRKLKKIGRQEVAGQLDHSFEAANLANLAATLLSADVESDNFRFETFFRTGNLAAL